MAESFELNCIGLKCPRPIIEVAKLARRSPAGAMIRVTADDLAFESDIRAWCETSGNTLLSLTSSGPRALTAEIQRVDKHD